MYVRDLEGEEYPAQLTRTWEGELNSSQSLTATILPSRVNLQFIHDLSEMWVIADDDVEYKIVYCKRQGNGKLLRVNIKAIPLFFDDFKSQRIYERYDSHMTAYAFFSLVFNGSGYGFVLNGTFEAQQWEGLGEGDTRINMFKDGLNRYKAEYRIVGKTIYLENLVGKDAQFRYEHRLNASNIVQEIDADEFYTYAKGYGDYGDGQGGDDWQSAKLIREYTSPLASISAIGFKHAPPIKNGKITSKETMDEQLKTLVDESLKISVSADIHDLTKQGYPIAQANLGDRVFLIDRRIGFEEEIRVVAMSITRDWKDKIIDMSITFGVPGLSKRHQSNINSATKNITRLLDGKLKLPFSVLDSAVTEATKALQRMESQLTITDNGTLMAVDASNPNNVVVYNAAGLGVSDDGGATFKNSVTGEGVIAETIVGESIIGVNIASLDEKGYFHVNGSDAEFYDTVSGRSVAISPDGLYGLNNGGDVRFQANSTLVTSSALGTSNTNTYLAAMHNGEVRVVDYAGIPGDGLVESYDYLPLRASGIYANFFNVNPAAGNPLHIYVRPLSGGELRSTLNGTTDVYQNIRGAGIKGNTFDLNKYSASTNNLYVRPGPDGELRITSEDSTTNYLSIRGNGFYGNFIDKGTDAGLNLYARPAGGGALKVTVRGTTDTFRPVEALEFNVNSSIFYKKNVEDYTGNASKLVTGTPVRQYHMLEDDEALDPKRIGLIVQESPQEIVNLDGGKSLNVDAKANLLWKAMQETIKRVEVLENEST